jgi:hypothetical protein
MTPLANLGPFVRPDLRWLLDSERDVTLRNINKIDVGIVQSWNAATQSVVVQLVYQRAVYNTPMNSSAIPPDPTVYQVPLLLDVPAWVLSGGSAYVAMPITKGDFAIVLFNDRDLDIWWKNGTIGAVPNTNRVHSLSDAMAIVGIRPATNPIPGLPTDGQHIGIGNQSGTLIAGLVALCTALTGWVDTRGDTPNTDTVNAINAAKAQLQGVLQ